MNYEQFQAYLKSGAWARPSVPISKPITLGPKTFKSVWHARQYVKRLIALQTPDELFQGDDLLIIKDVIKYYPYYDMLQKADIVAFTVEPHCGSKMLTGILRVKKFGHDGRKEISVDRCFDNMGKAPKRVIRQDSYDEAA
jgi:hypothetical protein